MTPAEAKVVASATAAALLRDGLLAYPEAIPFSNDDRAQICDAFVEIVVELFTRAGVRCCRKCGCTEDAACLDGCSWIGPDLCSSHPEESRIIVVSG